MGSTLDLAVAVAAALATLVLVAGLAVAGRGRRFAAFAGAPLLVSLLPLLAGAWLASRTASGAFSGFGALEAPAAVRASLHGCVWLLMIGAGACLVCLGVVGLGLVASLLWGGESQPQAPALSTRRAAFLVALALGPALAAGALFDYSRQTLDFTRVVVLVDGRTPAGRAEAARYDVLSIPGSRGIAAASSRVARGTVLGSLGAPFLMFVVAGAAVAAGLVGWPVAGARGAAVLWLLLAGLAAAAAIFWLGSLALELRALSSG